MCQPTILNILTKAGECSGSNPTYNNTLAAHAYNRLTTRTSTVQPIKERRGANMYMYVPGVGDEVKEMRE